MKSLFQVARWIMSIGALTWSLRATEFVVDQRNEFDGSGLVPFYTVGPIYSVGQEFTPATNSLSFVDLVTYGGGASSANLQVLIRQGALANPVLAASNLVLATNSTTVSTNRFSFTPGLPLVPGNTYVLQIVTSGNNFWSVAASSGTYPRGRMIHNGVPDASLDLWFREGFVVPAPASPLLSIAGSGAGRILVLATNISGNIRGYCVFESSPNLVTWIPVVTNLVYKTWSTNAFPSTNSMTFYRAWVY